MEFYQVFKFAGTIAVNRLSVRDMVYVQFITLIVFIILAAIVSLILPTLLLIIYCLWMFNNDGAGGEFNIKQRLFLNVLTVVAVIYYVLDFHYGWVSFQILGTVISVETMDKIAAYNLSLGLISLLLFLFGHELYRIGEIKLIRVILLISFVFFGFKFSSIVSSRLVASVITQCTDEFTTGVREEGYEPAYYKTDEERQRDIDEREREDQEKEERLRQFDRDYSDGKIIDFNR